MLVTDGKYMNGDIALIVARPALARWCKYDHAAMLWTCFGAWYTIEAGLTGVRDYRMGHWPRPADVYRLNGEDWLDGDEAVRAAMTMRGTRYAWEHLPAVLWRIIRRPLLAQAVVCTELVTWAWQQAGVELCPGVRSPSPDDIYRTVK